MSEPTDTPVNPSFPPVPLIERIKALIGDLARPYGLYALATAIAVAVVIIAIKVENGNDGAIFIGAVGLIFGGAYGFRAWENAQTSKHAASVEIAKTTATETGKTT